MRIVTIRSISKYIVRHYNADEMLLTDWITEHLKELCNNIDNIDIDYIFDELCDFATISFAKLIKEIEKQILANSPISRVNIKQVCDGVRIALNDLGIKGNLEISKDLYSKFNIVESQKNMDKGLFYEKFCSYFLEDIGLESCVTKASNDKGIDIFAKYKTKLHKDWGHLVFNDYVYLLGQAKFYSSKVDTPILRRLVGDSIFLRFDQIDYIEVAHNAIHLIVFSHNGFNEQAIEFAKKNKIMMMNTEQMISILCAHEFPQTSKAIMYITEYCNK